MHVDGHRLLRLQKQMMNQKLLIIDELGFVPLSKTGAELLFELISRRYERGSTLITSNLPFDEWTEVFGSERLTGALLDRLTHHVHILEMNGDAVHAEGMRRFGDGEPQGPNDLGPHKPAQMRRPPAFHISDAARCARGHRPRARSAFWSDALCRLA